jgi:hypothetical protein
MEVFLVMNFDDLKKGLSKVYEHSLLTLELQSANMLSHFFVIAALHNITVVIKLTKS